MQGDWGPWSSACGHGVRTRRVRCDGASCGGECPGPKPLARETSVLLIILSVVTSAFENPTPSLVHACVLAGMQRPICRVTDTHPMSTLWPSSCICLVTTELVGFQSDTRGLGLLPSGSAGRLTLTAAFRLAYGLSRALVTRAAQAAILASNRMMSTGGLRRRI